MRKFLLTLAVMLTACTFASAENVTEYFNTATTADWITSGEASQEVTSPSTGLVWNLQGVKLYTNSDNLYMMIPAKKSASTTVAMKCQEVVFHTSKSISLGAAKIKLQIDGKDVVAAQSVNVTDTDISFIIPESAQKQNATYTFVETANKNAQVAYITFVEASSTETPIDPDPVDPDPIDPSGAFSYEWEYNVNDMIVKDANNKTEGTLTIGNIEWAYESTEAIAVTKEGAWKGVGLGNKNAVNSNTVTISTDFFKGYRIAEITFSMGCKNEGMKYAYIIDGETVKSGDVTSDTNSESKKESYQWIGAVDCNSNLTISFTTVAEVVCYFAPITIKYYKVEEEFVPAAAPVMTGHDGASEGDEVTFAPVHSSHSLEYCEYSVLAEEPAAMKAPAEAEWTALAAGESHVHTVRALAENEAEYRLEVRAKDAKGNYSAPVVFAYNGTTGGDVTGIEAIEAEAGAVEYFNLQGVRIDGQLTPGVYIRRVGSKVVKVLVR